MTALGGVWLLGVGAGLWLLATYASTPGVAAAAPERWPAESRLTHTPGRATLIMIAHPYCPCTRASIGELDRLLAQAQGAAVDAYVLFLKPSTMGENWEQTDLWRTAAAMPGVRVIADDDGREAQAFGTATSGQTLLYDPAGRLVFSGGITAARGHSGDNPGRSAVVSLLMTAAADSTSSPVYGCPLGQGETICDGGPRDACSES